MSLSNKQINEMVDNLYDYICEDTKLTFDSMYGKVRTIKGHKFLEHIDETLKCGNHMPVLFPGEPEPVDVIQWQRHPTHSKKGTSLVTKKGLNSTQLHLNHVRRIQVD